MLIWPYFRKQNKRRFFPIKVRIYSHEVHIRDPFAQSRFRLDQCGGYLEDQWSYIVYDHPKLCRIFPKRAFSESRQQQFENILRGNLSPFDPAS